MEIINIKENEDGSADVELKLTYKELNSVVEIGLTQLLINGIKAEDLCEQLKDE